MNLLVCYPFLCYLPPPVWQYYEKILKLPNSRFKLTFVFEETALKLFKDIDENKASGLDNLSGEFQRDDTTVLVEPIIYLKSIQYLQLNIE